MARGRPGHFQWLVFDTDQMFFILKSILFLILCRVRQGCLLFLRLDTWFMVTQL